MEEHVKTLSYKGRVVFKKLNLPSLRRWTRQYYKNEACFAFITRGEYRVRGQTERFTINRGSALLAKCMNYFYENTADGQGEACQGEAIGVFLYPEIFRQMFDFDLNRSSYRVDYNLKQFAVDRLLEHYRDSIDILLETPERVNDILIENKLREFVILMTQKTGAPSELDFLASMFKPHFAAFEDVIQSNLYADLSLEELAKLCHMSLSTFKRKFSATYSQSPKQYITQLKIDKAKALLQIEDLRISDVAFQAGFESLSTFNRAFKTHTGQTPSDFRMS